MTLYFNQHSLQFSERNLRGYRIFHPGDLTTISDSLTTKSKALSSATEASKISKFIIDLITQNFIYQQGKEDSNDKIFDAYTVFCKKSVSLIKKQQDLSKKEKKAHNLIVQAFRKAAVVYNRAHPLQNKTAEVCAFSKNPMLNYSNGVFNHLNSEDAISALRAFNYEEDAISESTKSAILLNTFESFCITNSNSFLNHVCKKAVERRATTFLEKTNVLPNVLSDYFGQQTLSELLGDNIYLPNISLNDMGNLFERLENEYQTNLKSSYINFFDAVLNIQIAENVRLHQIITPLVYGPFATYSINFLYGTNLLGLYIDELYTVLPSFYLESHSQLNLSNMNLKIIPPELKRFKGLNILSLEGNDLKGIDISANTALKRLDLSGNKLTSIDVSRNIDLTTLYIEDNALKNINLLHNPLLEQIGLERNKLENIDLSNNPHLKTLGLHHNELAEIDVSRNVDLTWLGLSDNKLTSIDISNNRLLETLYLAENTVKNIDFTHNLFLKHVNLEENELENIDFSNNLHLSTFKLGHNRLAEIDISRNVNLTHIALDNNNLRRIDLSRNILLKESYLNKNKLSEIDLSNNTILETLVLSNNNLSQVDLSKNTAIKKLRLENNGLSSINLSSQPDLSDYILPNGCKIIRTPNIARG